MIRAFSSILILATCLQAPFGQGIPVKASVQPQTPVLAIQELYKAKPVINEVKKEIDPIHTNWTKPYGRGIWRQNRYNKHIKRSLKQWDNLDPLIFKSMMSQESGFSEHRKNRYGYTGILQLGAREAREMGLVVKKGCDQRKTPYYAIPAAAKLLKRKAMHLYQKGFSNYGTPKGDEYWKFVAAAYNAGEGTIVKAMKYAYGNEKPVEVRFEDLLKTSTGSIWDTPLFKAMPKRWRRVSKYKEIKNYAFDVVARARQG